MQRPVEPQIIDKRERAGYDVVFRREGCIQAGCLAHARRKFDELAKANVSPAATQATVRIARLYEVESQLRDRYSFTTGGTVTLLSVVPEPRTYALMLVELAGMAAHARHKQR